MTWWPMSNVIRHGKPIVVRGEEYLDEAIGSVKVYEIVIWDDFEDLGWLRFNDYSEFDDFTPIDFMELEDA